MDCSHIGEFYRGRSVLVTGGTGFMGKVLIEKLLRSCPEINQIFVLVRTKPGGKIEDRIQEIIDTPVQLVVLKRLAHVMTSDYFACADFRTAETE
jgi:fatty acyl-CoA reductase